MTVRIRLRRADDLDGCVRALATVFDIDAYPTNWPSDPARWLSPTGIHRALVAATDASIVGHMLLCQAGPGTLEICRLFVVPDARGHGLGADLLSTARDSAGGNRLELQVADHNRAAIGLYERTGWHRLGSCRADWLNPDGEPALVHRYLDCKMTLQN